MRLIFTQTQALAVARSYADEYDVPWVDARRTRTYWGWWVLTADMYLFDIDTGGQGRATAAVGLPFRGVTHFEFRPHDPTHIRLPPWAAFPLYTAGTMGWRQGSGEQYMTDWWVWFAALPDGRKVAYRERFPPPKWGCWPRFYDQGD